MTGRQAAAFAAIWVWHYVNATMERRRCLSVSFEIPSNVKLQHSIVRLLEKKKNNLKEKKLPNPVDPSFSQSTLKYSIAYSVAAETHSTHCVICIYSNIVAKVRYIKGEIVRADTWNWHSNGNGRWNKFFICFHFHFCLSAVFSLPTGKWNGPRIEFVMKAKNIGSDWTMLIDSRWVACCFGRPRWKEGINICPLVV